MIVFFIQLFQYNDTADKADITSYNINSTNWRVYDFTEFEWQDITQWSSNDLIVMKVKDSGLVKDAAFYNESLVLQVIACTFPVNPELIKETFYLTQRNFQKFQNLANFIYCNQDPVLSSMHHLPYSLVTSDSNFTYEVIISSEVCNDQFSRKVKVKNIQFTVYFSSLCRLTFFPLPIDFTLLVEGVQ